MNRRIVRALVRLHSRAWRERYGAEWTAMLLDMPARPDVIIDCAACALTTHRPKLSRLVAPAIVVVALVTFSGTSIYHLSKASENNHPASTEKRPVEHAGEQPAAYWHPANRPPSVRVRCA